MTKTPDVDTTASARQSLADAALLSWLAESAAPAAAPCTGIAAIPSAIGTRPLGFVAPAEQESPSELALLVRNERTSALLPTAPATESQWQVDEAEPCEPPAMESETTARSRRWRHAACLLAMLGLAVCWVMTGSRGDDERSSARRLATGDGTAANSAVFQLPNGAWACRMQDIRVGQRVLTELPEGVETDQGEADAEGEPDPATWRKLTLQAPKANGTFARVELLRSLKWIARYDAREGGTVDISVPECGIEGRARPSTRCRDNVGERDEPGIPPCVE